MLRSFFTYVVDNQAVIKTSVAFPFIHHYGTSTSRYALAYEGVTFKGRTEFYPEEKLIISYGYTLASDEPCSIVYYHD